LRVEEIPIEKIIIPEERARATFTDEQTAELRASIEQHGFTVPILVKDNQDGTFTLIDGEHRIMIAKELGYEKVPAVITQGDEKKITLLNILANTARGTQNPLDVAKALKKASDAGASIKELAAATGHTESWVKLYLALNDLPEPYQEALRDGVLKVGHIKEAMRLVKPEEIDAALQTAILYGWSVQIMKYYVEQRLASLKLAEERGDKEFLETPPTPSYAQQVVNYGDCMICHRKVPREDLSMPTICPDCRTLVSWLVDQLGDPKEAMQTVYNALSFYFQMLKREKQQIPQQVQTQEEEVKEEEVEEKESMEIDEETLKLAKKLKKLKEAGLL